MGAESSAVSSVHQAELLLYFTLLQLAIIVLAGRVGSCLAVSWGQAAAVGEIIVGIVLGPALFGWLLPGAFDDVFRSASGDPMHILSQLGLILLIFQIGMEFELAHLKARERRQSVMRIAIASMVVPFAAGYALGYGMTPALSPGASRTAAALFIGTAFSITALPILGRMLIELGIARQPLGAIAISAAAINDMAGWLLLALVIMLASAQFSPWQFGATLLLLGVYMALCWWLLRPLLRWLIGRLGGGHSAAQFHIVG